MGQYHISYVYVSHYLCMRHLFIYMRENRRKKNISIKVTDNVINQEDEMNYYINGDCAPIGRLGYSYGY